MKDNTLNYDLTTCLGKNNEEEMLQVATVAQSTSQEKKL